MRLVENLYVRLADAIIGKRQFEYQGVELNMEPPFERLPYYEAIKKYAKVDVRDKSFEELKEICDSLKLDHKKIFRNKLQMVVSYSMREKS